jgi:hypothetical protein
MQMASYNMDLTPSGPERISMAPKQVIMAETNNGVVSGNKFQNLTGERTGESNISPKKIGPTNKPQRPKLIYQAVM